MLQGSAIVTHYLRALSYQDSKEYFLSDGTMAMDWWNTLIARWSKAENKESESVLGHTDQAGLFIYFFAFIFLDLDLNVT